MKKECQSCRHLNNYCDSCQDGSNREDRDGSNIVWTDDSVIDFVNWYVRLHKLGIRYELENREVLKSFKNGDDPSRWNQNEDEATTELRKSLITIPCAAINKRLW